MELVNQAAIVTGGGSGLGEATARLLAQHQVKVAILDQNEAAAQAVANDIEGLAFACDVTDEAAVQAALEAAHALHGVARICVNCAGVAPASRIVGRDAVHDLAQFNHVIQVNLVGSFNVMRLAAAAMLQQPSEDKTQGVIINTASVAAFDGQIGQAAYSASKGGVAAMTLPAAREFAKFGIRVNAVAPGIMATPMMAAMPEKVQAQLAASVPFPARLGEPAEFAELIRHIIENDYLNATVIRLDGALRMS